VLDTVGEERKLIEEIRERQSRLVGKGSDVSGRRDAEGFYRGDDVGKVGKGRKREGFLKTMKREGKHGEMWRKIGL
jgi:hypothetical protein